MQESSPAIRRQPRERNRDVETKPDAGIEPATQSWQGRVMPLHQSGVIAKRTGPGTQSRVPGPDRLARDSRRTSPVACLLLITRLLLPAVLRGAIGTAITGGGVLSELGGCVEHGLHLTLRARATNSDTPPKTKAAWPPEVATPAVSTSWNLTNPSPAVRWGPPPLPAAWPHPRAASSLRRAGQPVARAASAASPDCSA